MILHCIFYERLDTDIIEFMDAIDEYTLDENKGWLDEKIGQVGDWKRYDPGIGEVRVIQVDVDDGDIANAFARTRIAGQVRK